MKLIYRGAEAELWETSYLDEKVIVKRRIKKPYKAEPLDKKLRHQRTKNEARLLRIAREVVRTPHVYEIGDTELKLEAIEGRRVKELFFNGKIEIARKIGKAIRQLHKKGIIHNDLTTSNMIFAENEIYFLDFGLGYISTNLEDQATDLLVFKRMLSSTHYDVFDKVWEEVLKGYQANKKIVEKIREIERRARYL